MIISIRIRKKTKISAYLIIGGRGIVVTENVLAPTKKIFNTRYCDVKHRKCLLFLTAARRKYYYYYYYDCSCCCCSNTRTVKQCATSINALYFTNI